MVKLEKIPGLLQKILRERTEIELVEPLDKKERPAAEDIHLHNDWELLLLSDRVRLVPPKTLHAGSRNIIFGLNFDPFSITYGALCVRFRPNSKFTNLAPEIFAMMSRVETTDPLFRKLFECGISALIHLLTVIPAANWTEQYREELSGAVYSFLKTHYYDSGLSLDSLSESFGKSSQYLNRITRKNSGLSLHLTLVEIRLQKACELLKTCEYSVAEIARMTGWKSPLYFSTSFRRRFQISPKKFQTLHKTGNLIK